MLGEASITSKEGLQLIQTGQKTIIHWDGFSIGPQEIVRFQQLNGNSSVLNRVVGGSESALLGTLLSNGKVYLINPNGVFIGPGARIETAGLIASTLDLLDADYIAEQALLFQGMSEGKIIHLGDIHCPTGDVVLIGRTVRSEGEIKAPQGSALLATGLEVLLMPEGDQRIFIRPQLETEGTSLEQSGQIEALTVELQSGSNPYEKAIQCSGTIQATGFAEKGGRIYLVADEGTCELSGTLLATHETEKGGSVRILGTDVHLIDQATIDVSGGSAGGEVLIGGDYQGKNPAIPNAERTWVGPKTIIRADAREKGNGGKVILWGDRATHHSGHISIRGGQNGGDGGFAEISGEYLEFEGFVDSKALGAPGTVLLDPADISITGTGSPTNGSFTGGVWTSTGTPATIPSTVDANSVQTLLQSGTSVIIDTSAGGVVGGVTGSISFGGTLITWSTTAKLTLIADGPIFLGPLSNTNPSTGFTAMDFLAKGTTSVAAQSGVNLSTNTTISTVGGDIIFTGSTLSSSTTTTAFGIIMGTGGVVTSTGGGNITFTGTSNAGSGISLSSTAIVSAANGGNITLTGTTNNAVSTTNIAGVRITGTASVSTGVGASGTISIAGRATGTANSAVGVLIDSTNTAAVSTGSGGTSPIKISGTSVATSGALNHGVSITTSGWSTGTSGTVTFGDTIGSISGCTAASGTGLSFSGLSTVGSIVATNSISGTRGCSISSSLASTGGGSISITAAGTGTGGGTVGTGLSTSNLSTTGTGSITLIGTGTGTSSSSQGVSISATTISLGTGTLQIAGTMTGGTTGSSQGVAIFATTCTSSGPIQISGRSTSAGLNSHGVTLTGGWAGTRSGPITFGTTIGSISGCVGAGGTTCHGVNIGTSSTFIAPGGIQTANTIQGGSVSGSVAFNSTAAITAPLTISTTSTGSGTSGNIVLGGAVVLGGASTLTTSGADTITFSSTINSDDVSTPRALTATTSGGTVTFNGIVGGTAPLASLSATGSTAIQIGGSQTVTSGPMNYVGPVSISANTLLTNSGTTAISFSSTVNSSSLITPFILTVNGTGCPVTFSGAIGGTAPLTSLTVNGQSIAVNSITTTGNISLQPSISTFTNGQGVQTVGTIQLNGTSIQTGASGAVSLSPSGPFSPTSIATMYGNYTTENSLSIQSGSFTMGPNTALTVYGNMTINVTGAATVGDIVALDALSITASSIYLTPRSAVDLLSSLGTFYNSPATHLCSRIAPVLSVAATPAGAVVETVSIDRSLFKSALFYSPSSLVLNFDNSDLSSAQDQLTNQYLIANSQLFSLLPFFNNYYWFPVHGKVCSGDDEGCKSRENQPLIPENGILE